MGAVAVSDSAERQTLLGALLTWCDASLVQDLRDRERRHTEYDLSALSRGYISRAEELRRPFEREWMLGAPDLTLVLEAWQRLERDFGRRMEAEEFYLSGVQTSPDLTTTPRPIPGVWASDCQFNFQKGTVTVANRRFVAVSASRVEAAEPATSPIAGSNASDDPGPTGSAGNDGGERQRRGRDAHTATIRAGLIDGWETVQRQVQRDGSPNWSEIARTVERRLKAMRAKDGTTIVSQFHTIRTRLPDIYAEVLIEKGGRD